jgi:hypothetical protein
MEHALTASNDGEYVMPGKHCQQAMYYARNFEAMFPLLDCKRSLEATVTCSMGWKMLNNQGTLSEFV